MTDYLDHKLQEIYGWITHTVSVFRIDVPWPYEFSQYDRFVLRKMVRTLGPERTADIVRSAYTQLTPMDWAGSYWKPQYVLRHWKRWHENLDKDERMRHLSSMLDGARARWDLDEDDTDLLKWYWAQAEKSNAEPVQTFDEWLAEEVGNDEAL